MQNTNKLRTFLSSFRARSPTSKNPKKNTHHTRLSSRARAGHGLTTSTHIFRLRLGLSLFRLISPRPPSFAGPFENPPTRKTYQNSEIRKTRSSSSSGGGLDNTLSLSPLLFLGKHLPPLSSHRGPPCGHIRRARERSSETGWMDMARRKIMERNDLLLLLVSFSKFLSLCRDDVSNCKTTNRIGSDFN